MGGEYFADADERKAYETTCDTVKWWAEESFYEPVARQMWFASREYWRSKLGQQQRKGDGT